MDVSSLNEAQLADWLASPMSEQEIQRLEKLEEQLKAAFLQEYAAELEHGKALLELRDHPRLLWQRDAMFKTKAGKWKKSRSWNAFIKEHGLAESGSDANRLISQWLLHERTLDAALSLQQEMPNG